MNLARQDHLNYADRINQGAYYTGDEYVQQVWGMIGPYLGGGMKVVDTACGYGNFLRSDFACEKIGNDIDSIAVATARKNLPHTFFNTNALCEVGRSKFGLTKNDKLCIVGNPPYNDVTSMVRSGIKQFAGDIDIDIKTRDLGMSFLLSYAKLDADIVCVLHPLSYLIKKSNFNLLKNFTNKYKLIEGRIISSGVFCQASKSMQFPIVIALYTKNNSGTKYTDILNFKWQIDNKSLQLSQFDYIPNYIKKYPSKHIQPKKDDLFFWTMRDINALKRNQTFIAKHSGNAIIIDKNKLDYYIYVDVFKQFTDKIPYYFGNCNVPIDNNLFQQYKKYFILQAISRHNYLHKYFTSFYFADIKLSYTNKKISEYLQKLLGAHYVCQKITN